MALKDDEKDLYHATSHDDEPGGQEKVSKDFDRLRCEYVQQRFDDGDFGQTKAYAQEDEADKVHLLYSLRPCDPARDIPYVFSKAGMHGSKIDRALQQEEKGGTKHNIWGEFKSDWAAKVGGRRSSALTVICKELLCHEGSGVHPGTHKANHDGNEQSIGQSDRPRLGRLVVHIVEDGL